MILAFGAQAQSNVYRWVDKNGKVHFSDQPPAEDAKSVSQKRFGGGYVQESSLPYATQVAAKRNPVVLYSGPKCGALCDSARELLAARGVPFRDRDVEATKEAADAVHKMIGSYSVPVLVVGDRHLKGYDADTWQAALDGAGYPRATLPGQADTVRQASKPPGPAPGQPPANAPAAEPSPGK
jgi:glutaredoxin